MSEELFLNHLGRYRLSLARIAEKHFFPDGNCKSELKRLKTASKIQVCGTGRSPDGFSFLQLSSEEARRRKMAHRGAPLTGGQLHKNLAILWFCMCGPHERVRLESHEYPDQLGPPPTQKEPLCLEKSPRGIYVTRVIVPGSTASLEHALRTVYDEAATLLLHPVSRRALNDRIIRFVLLVELDSRRVHCEETIERTRVDALRDVEIAVELAPGPTTLRSFLGSV